jgi:hypothetical protein
MKRRLLKDTALLIDVGAPLVATMNYFPIWVNRSAESTVSGLFLFFAILCAIPLLKYFKRFIKSPSAPVMWGLLFATFLALRSILDEMVVISFVGFVANIIGLVLFKYAERGEETSGSN